VRVISLETSAEELCGGTPHRPHRATSACSRSLPNPAWPPACAGIEALTGAAALEFVQATARYWWRPAHLLKEKPEALAQRIAKCSRM